MFSAAHTQSVVDPRKSLTASQVSVLRELDRCGRAFKARNGWKLGGMFRRTATIRPLVSQGLAREDFKDAKHVLVLTYAGRCAVAMLSPAPAAPAGSREN